MEKRRGTSASLYWQRAGLADEVGSDAIPDAAGGEGGHGAAKPEGVIHRFIIYHCKSYNRTPQKTAALRPDIGDETRRGVYRIY